MIRLCLLFRIFSILRLTFMDFGVIPKKLFYARKFLTVWNNIKWHLEQHYCSRAKTEGA